MKGYIQINVKLANVLYPKPAEQYESDFSMTNKVHDINLILLVFLNLGNSLKSLHFQCVKVILIIPIFYVLLTNEHSLTYNQNNPFAFFFEIYIKAAIQVLHF